MNGHSKEDLQKKKELAGIPAPEKSECAHVGWEVTLAVSFADLWSTLFLFTFANWAGRSDTIHYTSRPCQRPMAAAAVRERAWCREKSLQAPGMQPPCQDHTRTPWEAPTGAAERQSLSCIYIPDVL